MPFIPHTTEDIREMQTAIGISRLEQLFDEVPSTIPQADLTAVPEGCSELAITREMIDRAPNAKPGSCFIGAGAYEHHIPAAVWQIAGRGEFYTAYTPYQAEASQGSLQLIYEYQTMMAELMATDISNASLYDGSTALAEACLMAIRIHKKNTQKILIPATVHPTYQRVLATILQQQNIELIPVIMDQKTGTIDRELLQQQTLDQVAALVIPQPNFFGCLEPVDLLTDWAHANQLLVIAVVNPMAMALVTPPGLWGEQGADIVCGEGQPLGSPLAYGGPYFGFMCCKKEFVRQMPGRLVGRTHDKEGRTGYTLTLQAREQHIRRAKATSNICTNQGLLVVAATIYMSLLGAKGLNEVARLCHHNAHYLRKKLADINGVEIIFSGPCWHEFVVKVPLAASVIQAMRRQGIQAGYLLDHLADPFFKNTLLIAVTETKTQQDLDRYVECFKNALVDRGISA